jgi:hypothetical protein
LKKTSEPHTGASPIWLDSLIDRLRTSREFTISLLVHIIFVAIFGGTVLFQATQEPPDFEGEGGFVAGGGEQVSAPPQPTQQMPQTQDITVTATPVNTSPINAITTTATSPMNFNMTQMVMAPPMPTTPTAAQMAAPKPVAPAGGMSGGMTGADASAIKAFSQGWGKGSGSGTGTRSREFEFTAYIGQYSGGDWNSTVSTVGDQKGVLNNGSLPNLLAYMSTRSRNKVKTNFDKVRAIKLDSAELFSIKPPFIFMTGTKDFRLTEAEVENLRKYVRVGGAIWGDSSVPGRNSRFDIAFRREMRRVLPDKDKDWEELPKNHPLFDKSKVYFPEVTQIPPGLNFFQEPVYALKIYGEIAVIYTANDYGDMWQIGLLPDGKVDLRRNEKNQFIAINQGLWDNRGDYIRNITEPALDATYKFGTNIVLHLLTRWESKVKSAPSL